MDIKDIYLEGNKDAVLLIHGLGGTPVEMKYIAEYLNKEGFTVFVPCLAGHAKSFKELKKAIWQDWYFDLIKSFKDLKKNYSSVSIVGQCMGANLALYMASQLKNEVKAISVLSTTLFIDGWNIPWYAPFASIAYYPPIKYFYSFNEREPYGIKDEKKRKIFLRALGMNKNSNYSIPSDSLHENHKLIKIVKQSISAVTTPALIIHAVEDDTASVKNAMYVKNNIASEIKRTVFLDDSYHIIAIDNQRDVAAKEIAMFIKESLQLKLEIS